MTEAIEKPLTREDVLKAIEKNGGKAQGLQLSGKRFVGGVNLGNLNLSRIGLVGAHLEGARLDGAHLEEAYLGGAHLEGAELQRAHLERAQLRGAHLEGAQLGSAHFEKANLWDANLEGADLGDANLEGAYLWRANLKGACLMNANLEGAKLLAVNLEEADLTYANLEGTYLGHSHLERVYLEGVKLSPDTELYDVHWGNYILGEETRRFFDRAAHTYRQLKQWHTNAGMYGVAGNFFYREMEARRKSRRWKAGPHLKLWYWILRLLCGYGEKAERVVISAIVLIFGLAAAYFFFSAFSSVTFLGCLYYSVVSFTALGYGSWVHPEPASWAKGLGAAEAVLGVFMMALFLVTFTRKMTR